MFKKKILVVDDTALMRKLVSDILTESGYDVIPVENGLIALELVDKEKPDMVILDVEMPGISGFEVCETLRSDISNNLMPILMLTSLTKEEDKLCGLELGADDYIIKPFNKRELLSRVYNTFRRIDINRFANPLTGLHGNIEIQSEITKKLANNEPLSIIYADLDNFKAFNDVYGFAKGDTAIILTADVIRDNLSAFGNKHDFEGHVGGDDFICITTPDKHEQICENIIKDFDDKIVTLYNKKDVGQGFIQTKNRRNRTVKFPIMSISLAVVTNNSRILKNHIIVSEIAAEVKKVAKSMKGSSYFIDRRIK